MSYYDDNYGWWEGSDDPESDAWFRDHVQRSSVEKTCAGCGRKVRLMPDYDVCDSCATKREAGWDL